jgi:hypothetical protein
MIDRLAAKNLEPELLPDIYLMNLPRTEVPMRSKLGRETKKMRLNTLRRDTMTQLPHRRQTGSHASAPPIWSLFPKSALRDCRPLPAPGESYYRNAAVPPTTTERVFSGTKAVAKTWLSIFNQIGGKECPASPRR